MATQPARAQGRLYHLPLGYPAMTLEPGWVQGVLLTFPNAGCLKPIDAFEEYDPDRPSSSEYQRHRQLIYDNSQQSIGLAWVYTMDHDRVIALKGRWLSQGFWTEAQTM